jgi:hypothetical protein
MLWNMVFAMKKIRIFVIFLLVILVSFSLVKNIVYSQTDSPTPSPSPTSAPDTSALENKIKELQGKISDLQVQEKPYLLKYLLWITR